MTVIDFAKEYPIEREKAFRILNGCKNMEQVEMAKNYFDALKQKWGNVCAKNGTVKLMFDTDEERFLSEVKKIISQFLS
jgi:hypothetical protein